MCEVSPGMRRRRLSESLHTQLSMCVWWSQAQVDRQTGRQRQADIVADSTAATILSKLILTVCS